MEPVPFFKSLADETRLKCLLLIEQRGELCVCELTEALQEIQPKISRHLAQLRTTGLLKDRRQGQWVYYSLAADLPEWCRAVLQQSLAGNRSFLERCNRHLDEMNCGSNGATVCC